MGQSPYLVQGRLQDVVALLQFLALVDDYDLDPSKLRKKIAHDPVSAPDWQKVVADHPEFFRESEIEGDCCLVMRRAQPKTGTQRLRPKLDSTQLKLLVDTAIQLQNHALEIKRERGKWIPLVVGFAGVILGALIGTLG